MPVSLNPNDFVQGGLLSDVDVEIVTARFTAWDYDGTLPSPDVLAVKLTMKVLDDDSEHEEYISCGKVADFAPNPEDEGCTLVENGSKSKLNKNSNWWLFLTSAVEAGMDPTPLGEGNLSVLDGAKFHLIRKAAPKREGLTITKKQEGRESTYLAVDKVIALPWDKKGAAKGKATAKPAAKAAAAAKPAAGADKAKPKPEASEMSEEVTVRAMEVITEVLGESSDPVKIASMRMLVFRKMGKDKGDVRTAVLAAATDPTWLAENGFNVDGDLVSIG